jgi:sulfide:quinone oxidoreductase
MMKITTLSDKFSISDQIQSEDIAELAEQGVQLIICNRPDGEAADQPSVESITRAAAALNIELIHMPFAAGQLTEELVAGFQQKLSGNLKVHAYCRTGNRSTQLYQALSSGEPESKPSRVQSAASATQHFDVVVIGAGSGGIAVSSSLLKRNRELRIAVIDPATKHYYQPGWTLVGGGVFDAKATQRDTSSLVDKRVSLLQQAVTQVTPEKDRVILQDGSEVHYDQLVVAPGLVLNWGAIEGLEETLGKNGVTSNYRYDLAPYTWELVQQTRAGKAIFTQPPMPIKCAGAPQKALYLSADYWLKHNRLKDIHIDFCNAGGVLFGVPAYVGALESYMEKYNVSPSYNHNLIKVDGEKRQAWFVVTDAEGKQSEVCKDFDMLHVCPVQQAPTFIADSGLSDQAGWLSVDPNSLRHSQYANIWGLGDVMNTSNAKTMAAVRKQVPVVAKNITSVRAGQMPAARYDGYGSCPLTVERGKIVLAEFCYGGRVAPSFPSWLNSGTKPTRLAWWLKSLALPFVYWQLMLKGREWMTTCSEENA